MKFMMGLLAHFLGFGIKDLGFAIQDAYFSSSFMLSIAYFFLHFCVVLILINVLLHVRRWVFAMPAEVTSKEGQRLAQTADFDNANENEDETDVQLQLQHMHGASDPLHAAGYWKDNNVRDKERETIFYLYNEIEFDVWQVSMGLTVLEMVLYMSSSEWIPIETTGEEYTEKTRYGGYTIGVASSLILIYILWTRIVAFLQMQADRYHCKWLVVHAHQEIPLEARTNDDIDANTEVHRSTQYTDHQHEMLQFAFNHRSTIDRWSMFIDGFIGWAVGWTIVCNVFLQDNVWFRLCFAIAFTVLSLLLTIWRAKSLRKRIQTWQEKAFHIQQSHNDLAANEGDQHALNETHVQSDAALEMSSNVTSRFLEDAMKSSGYLTSENSVGVDGANDRRQKVEADLNIGKDRCFFENLATLKRTNKEAHLQFYRYYHFNYSIRKGYALIVGLPWEATIDLIIKQIDIRYIDQIWIRCAVAFITTLTLSYFGIQCVKLQNQKCPQMGNDELIKEILSEFHHRILDKRTTHIDLDTVD
ncbi:hypothetical protein RFI_00631, partial [Reticulomyxa filosa]